MWCIVLKGYTKTTYRVLRPTRRRRPKAPLGIPQEISPLRCRSPHLSVLHSIVSCLHNSYYFFVWICSKQYSFVKGVNITSLLKLLGKT